MAIRKKVKPQVNALLEILTVNTPLLIIIMDIGSVITIYLHLPLSMVNAIFLLN